MATLLQVLEMYGLAVVFLAVLLDQGGLPVPAYPIMVVASATAVNSGEPAWPTLAVAVLATLLADLLWFAGGRRFGAAMLRTMCRVSLSPDSCVGRTRRTYARWGAPSLIIAKYIPGLAAVATTLAGETRTGLARFALFDGIGAAFWAGGAIALGIIFNEAVEDMLAELERLGNYAVMLLLAALVAFVCIKWWQRHRFLMKIRMARILPAELEALLSAGSTVTIIDARSVDRRTRDERIPGSIDVARLGDLAMDPGNEVVVYCDCPNDASAALIAKQLQAKGYAHVRPLAGGIDAWRASGYRMETTLSGAASSR
jgi:membrane protein DedA with SNARE-associated domain/rhodanese-related sulfurtransferase